MRLLDPGQAKELLRQVRELGCHYIDFTGGEPTLYPELPQLLSYARSLGMKTEVTTNGLGGGDEYLLQCAAYADVFNISLDTLDRELYARIRGVDGLGKVLRSVDAVRKLRQDRCMDPLKLMVVVSEKNLAGLPSLLRYAREKGAELYLNSQFIYGSQGGEGWFHLFTQDLLPYVLRGNTIVPLHFLELYQDIASGAGRRCVSNRNILTLGSDGSLLLPCYPAKEHIWLPWKGNLQEMLEKAAFQEGAALCGNMPECGKCMFTPYFSFSFRTLGKLFLLESFCDRLTQLKREYLNPLGIDTENDHLLSHLSELLSLLRSFQTKRSVPEGQLYWAQEGDKVDTEVYRNPISLEQFRLEQEAKSCWQLEPLPHNLYDDINRAVYQPVFLRIQAGVRETGNLMELLEGAIEFMLRWWKVCIAARLKVDNGYDQRDDRIWLWEYFSKAQRFCVENQLPPPPLPDEILQGKSDVWQFQGSRKEEQPGRERIRRFICTHPISAGEEAQPDWKHIFMEGRISGAIGIARVSLPLSPPVEEGPRIRGYHVFSTEPFRVRNTGTDFPIPEYQRLTMELSARLWRRYNGPIRLITDALGREYLARYGMLDLYEEVLPLTDADVYGINCKKFWASGKILALKGLETPCAIIDLDLLIWKKLSLADAPLVTMHTEFLNGLYYPGFSYFKMDPSYEFHKDWDESVEPLNTAFLYISDGGLKDFYVRESIRFMRNERNTPDFDGSTCMIFAEQRILAMCAAVKKVYVKTLLNYSRLSSPQSLATHLWCGKEVFEQHEELRQIYGSSCHDRLSEFS